MLQILRNPIYVGERVHAGGTVEGVHEGIIDAELAQRTWRAIDERRTRQPEPRGLALEWDRNPYMLRGLLRCAGCERVMTTSASTKVTIDNADEVPAGFTLDTIAIDNFIEQGGERFADLPPRRTPT